MKQYDIQALAILLERLRRMPKPGKMKKIHARMRKHMGPGAKRG